MNSGSSAFIGSGGQSALTPLPRPRTRRRGRPACRPALPVTLTTMHLGHARRLGQRLVDVLLERNGLAAAPAFVGRDDDLAVAIVDAAGDRFRREAAEDHRMHRADARAGQHRHRRVGHHRHVDGDAVALLDALRLEHIGEAADPLVQLRVGDLGVGAGRVALPDDRRLVAARLRGAGRRSWPKC